MTTITKQMAAAIRADLNAAMAAVSAKHGVDFALGNIIFTAETIRTKLTGVVRGAAGTTGASVAATVQAVALQKVGMRGLSYPVKPTDVFTSPSLGKVTIVGYNTKAKQYPYIIQQVATGARYKMSTRDANAMVMTLNTLIKL